MVMQRYLRALNAHLPDDIVVQAVFQAAENFHPRYDALSRTYVYRIYWQQARNPLIDRFAWHLNGLCELGEHERCGKFTGWRA